MTKTDPAMPELYTTHEAAEYCGMTFEGFKMYVRKGQVVPDLSKVQRHFFTRQTLDAFLAEPRRKPGQPRKEVACPHCGEQFALTPRPRKKRDEAASPA